MARDFLSPLSETFLKKARHTVGRKRKFVGVLDDAYDLPSGGADQAIAMLREGGYAKKLNRGIVYEDRLAYKLPYVYLHGDADLRKQMDDRRADPEKTEFLGLNCLLEDNPDIKTWEDVEAKLALSAAGLGQDEEGKGIVVAHMEDVEDTNGMLTTPWPLEMLAPRLAEARGAIQRIEAQLAGLILQQRKQEEHDRRVIAAMQSENAHLRQRLEQWLSQETIAVKGVADIQDRGRHIEYMLMIAVNGLPETTSISATGWQKELPIRYLRDRDGFCDRFQSGEYGKSEKEQITKAVRFLARFGPRHPSLHTEIFRHALPGIPSDIGDFSYGRASRDLRIAWKQIGDFLHVLNIYKHRSGGGSSLPDIR